MKNCKYKHQPGSHCNGHGQSCPYYNKHYWCQAYDKTDDYLKYVLYAIIVLIAVWIAIWIINN